MAIKVDVLTPVASVSEVTGSSQVVEVIKSSQTPLTTDSTRAVVDIAGPISVVGIVVQQTEPIDPHEDMVWLSW